MRVRPIDTETQSDTGDIAPTLACRERASCAASAPSDARSPNENGPLKIGVYSGPATEPVQGTRLRES